MKSDITTYEQSRQSMNMKLYIKTYEKNWIMLGVKIIIVSRASVGTIDTKIIIVIGTLSSASQVVGV